MPTQGQRLIASAGITVEVEDHKFPDPGPNQMLVRVTRSQVSAGSEMNGIRAIQNQPDVRRPIGYTTVGYVEKLGAGVVDYREGDRVLCFGNHASHCLVSLTVNSGGDWQAQPDLVPDNITDEQAALGVLGDVALHGIRRATLQLDQSVAVFGAGTVGQLTIQFARISGAYPIVAVDLVPSRLDKARQSGATHVVDASQGNPVEGVFAATNGRGAEAVFHCSANPKILQTTMEAAADRATVVLSGSAPGTAEIGLQVELLRRELKIVGNYETGLLEPHPYWPWTRRRNRRATFRLIASGELKVDHLLTHVVPPTRAQEMYRMIAAGGSDWLTVTFAWA